MIVCNPYHCENKTQIIIIIMMDCCIEKFCYNTQRIQDTREKLGNWVGIRNVIDFPLTLSRSCKGPRGALAMIFLQHFCV